MGAPSGSQFTLQRIWGLNQRDPTECRVGDFESGSWGSHRARSWYHTTHLPGESQSFDIKVQLEICTGHDDFQCFHRVRLGPEAALEKARPRNPSKTHRWWPAFRCKEAHYPGKRPQTVWGKCISMLMMMVRMMIGHEQVSAIVVRRWQCRDRLNRLWNHTLENISHMAACLYPQTQQQLRASADNLF